MKRSEKIGENIWRKSRQYPIPRKGNQPVGLNAEKAVRPSHF